MAPVEHRTSRGYHDSHLAMSTQNMAGGWTDRKLLTLSGLQKLHPSREQLADKWGVFICRRSCGGTPSGEQREPRTAQQTRGYTVRSCSLLSGSHLVCSGKEWIWVEVRLRFRRRSEVNSPFMIEMVVWPSESVTIFYERDKVQR